MVHMILAFKTHLFGHLQFKTGIQNFHRDDRKTLFNHYSLHVISLRGLGVKANAIKGPLSQLMDE